MKVVAIIQARMGSSRLPGKIAKPILGTPMLVRMLGRVKRAHRLDSIVVATSDLPSDDVTVELAREAGVGVFRGSEKDVLDRYFRAGKEAQADVVMRLTGDCPLMDPDVIDRVITHFYEKKGIDYTSTPRNYPEGLDTEVFRYSALEQAARRAVLPSEREHVTLFIKNHPEQFVIDTWEEGIQHNETMHWSVDTEADFAFVTTVFEALLPTNPHFGKDDVLALLRVHPELMEINKGGTGFEGLQKSLEEDKKFLGNDPAL